MAKEELRPGRKTNFVRAINVQGQWRIQNHKENIWEMYVFQFGSETFHFCNKPGDKWCVKIKVTERTEIGNCLASSCIVLKLRRMWQLAITAQTLSYNTAHSLSPYKKGNNSHRKFMSSSHNFRNFILQNRTVKIRNYGTCSNVITQLITT
jgi:hypothetical protein